MSRGSTAPQISRMRSASVDFPWSMCARSEKQRLAAMSDMSLLSVARRREVGGAGILLPFTPLSFGASFLVANIKSQIKRNRQNIKRQLRNQSVRSELKTRIKRAEQAAAAGQDDVQVKLQSAIKALDVAAAKGVIHANQAANRKSGLMKRAARLGAPS